jgi:hypothetical protein
MRLSQLEEVIEVQKQMLDSRPIAAFAVGREVGQEACHDAREVVNKGEEESKWGLKALEEALQERNFAAKKLAEYEAECLKLTGDAAEYLVQVQL